jgi:hypothetical protein
MPHDFHAMEGIMESASLCAQQEGEGGSGRDKKWLLFPRSPDEEHGSGEPDDHGCRQED